MKEPKKYELPLGDRCNDCIRAQRCLRLRIEDCPYLRKEATNDRDK